MAGLAWVGVDEYAKIWVTWRLHRDYGAPMAKVRFTAGRIDDFKCEAGKPQSFLWDTVSPGLGLRATASGAKSYIFQAKLNQQTIRITIGDPRTWDIPLLRQRRAG